MTDRSRLAAILNVEEDEEFEVKDFNVTCRIHDGELQYDFSANRCFIAATRIDILTAIINNPSLIICKPRYNDEEMTFLRLLHKYGKVIQLARWKSGGSETKLDPSGEFTVMGNVIKSLLEPGETVNLDEMFKEGADND